MSQLTIDGAQQNKSYSCLPIDPTVQKIILFVAGFLLLAAGLSMYFIHVNSIASINPIISYVTMGVGGSLLLGTAIWSVIDLLRGGIAQPSKGMESSIGNTPVSKWIEQFKENVNESSPKEAPSSELILSEAQEKSLTSIVQNPRNLHTNPEVTLYGSSSVFAFSIKTIPNIIFKWPIGGEVQFQKRMAASQKAREVIAEQKLNLLHVPRQKLISIDINGELTKILMEEQFDIQHGHRQQEVLFQHCIADEQLNLFIRKCAEQLIILIIEMGYSDVRYDNNPLLTNGQGLALIDLDMSNEPYTRTIGLVSGCSNTYIEGILNCISLDMLDSFKDLLEKKLGPQLFSDLDFDTLRDHLVKDNQRNQDFQKYLMEKNITTGKEEVSLQGFFSKDPYITDIQDKINEFTSKNLGLSLVAERKFYIRTDLKKDVLNQLKKKGLIFDWISLVERSGDTLFGYGFFVWC